MSAWETTGEASSPCSEALEGLLGDGEAAGKEIDSGGGGTPGFGLPASVAARCVRERAERGAGGSGARGAFYRLERGREGAAVMELSGGRH